METSRTPASLSSNERIRVAQPSQGVGVYFPEHAWSFSADVEWTEMPVGASVSRSAKETRQDED